MERFNYIARPLLCNLITNKSCLVSRAYTQIHYPTVVQAVGGGGGGGGMELLPGVFDLLYYVMLAESL